eukprot:3926028-Ditylum_brightwellii.AAC.1
MSTTESFNTNLPSMKLTCYSHIAGEYGYSTAECYNVGTKQWNGINSIGTEYWGAAAVSLGNIIAVMGGHAYSSLSSTEHYDTTSGKWSAFPSMNRVYFGCAAAVLDGKIIV